MISLSEYPDNGFLRKTDSGCPRRLSLASTFKNCQLSEGSQDCSQSQPVLTIPENAPNDQPMPLRHAYSYLSVEIQSMASQELLCTPDFVTPADQHTHGIPDVSAAIEMEESRSPMNMSPRRHIKRPRHISIGAAEGDTQSYYSQGSQRSTGEPSTSSQATSGVHGRPPRPTSKGSRLQTGSAKSPKAHSNPFLKLDSTPAQTASTPNTQFFKYPVSKSRMEFKVGKEVGSGNFSKVYIATGRLDGQTYALKKTKWPMQEEKDRRQWLKEVQAWAAACPHPNIVQYYSAWAEPELNYGDSLFIQLEYCPKNLGQMFKSGHRFDESELMVIMKQIGTALGHLHKLGMAHLDVKPDNIFKCNDDVYKLGDFGLATLKDGTAPVEEGDARYCPAELLNNRTDCLDKADIFALGATLYEFAKGEELPKGGTVYEKIRAGELMMLPTYSARLMNLIKSMMSMDPKLRPTAEYIAGQQLPPAKAPLQLTSTKPLNAGNLPGSAPPKLPASAPPKSSGSRTIHRKK